MGASASISVNRNRFVENGVLYNTYIDPVWIFDKYVAGASVQQEANCRERLSRHNYGVFIFSIVADEEDAMTKEKSMSLRSNTLAPMPRNMSVMLCGAILLITVGKEAGFTV